MIRILILLSAVVIFLLGVMIVRALLHPRRQKEPCDCSTLELEGMLAQAYRNRETATCLELILEIESREPDNLTVSKIKPRVMESLEDE